jgi:hypothetical protein
LTPEAQRALHDKHRVFREEKTKALDPVSTEARAAQVLRDFFTSMGWEYKEQYPTKSNGLIDFVVKALHQDGHIFFGVECKRQLHDETAATELADYLEQAQAYSRDLNMPVFIGPFMSEKRGDSLWQGGSKNLTAVASFNIFGGRSNVGTIVHSKYSTYTASQWCIVLRGNYFLSYDGQFNPSRLTMVDTVNSNKKRKPMKIWPAKYIVTEWDD